MGTTGSGVDGVRSAKPARLALAHGPRGVTLGRTGAKAFALGPLRVRLKVDGQWIDLRPSKPAQAGDGVRRDWRGPSAVVVQHFHHDSPSRCRIETTLTNTGPRPLVFGHIDLLTTDDVRGARIAPGPDAARARILEQSAYVAQVRSIGQILTGSDGRKSLGNTPREFHSQLVSILFNPADGHALLTAFESFDRFIGTIAGGAGAAPKAASKEQANVDGSTAAGSAKFTLTRSAPGAKDRLTRWSVGLSGAGVPIAPGETITLESLVLEVGTDPHAMLERYADRVAARYRVHALPGGIPAGLVNWCSWYPYRLGLTEGLMLDTARAAKARHLDKLGLRFIQADLGWEKDNIPTYFEENERFPHGLKWLAGRIEELGFELGVWKGFACVAADHPVAREHPQWLVHDDKGGLVDSGKWFWPPHCLTHALDASHPQAVEWVRRSVRSLAERGVRYLKWDFGGVVTCAGVRHDPRVACGGAAEGIRRIARAVREAMDAGSGWDGGEAAAKVRANGSRAKRPASAPVVLDCTGIEVGGVGNFQLLYGNWDTGNTGIGFAHLRWTYESMACHLFKNHRMGLMQPSCLVVGLPGTLEEARLRATATFLSAGHVDIGDTLTNLPEERWSVLLSVLPAMPSGARVVDLYHPVRVGTNDYVALCKGEDSAGPWTDEPLGGNIWHKRIEADWDRWDLVGVFNISDPEREKGQAPPARRFDIPLSLLGLPAKARLWAHEFWSGQLLGDAPRPLRPAEAYRHPGDTQALLDESAPGMLAVTFAGPAVKLLVLRTSRSHPWPVATTFHQSGGLELAHVAWDSKRRTLRGELHRPPGQQGSIFVAGIPADATPRARVNGAAVPIHRGANGVLVIPVTTADWKTHWDVRLG